MLQFITHHTDRYDEIAGTRAVLEGGCRWVQLRMKDASEEFKALEQKLSHNLDRDLDYFAKDIKNMIAQDIIKRYYFQRGGIIQQLKDDDDLNEAVKVLGNSEEYKKMLSVPETTVIKEKGKETSLVNFNSYRKSSLMIFDYVV